MNRFLQARLAKFILLMFGSSLLVITFQNCGQAGSIHSSADPSLKIDLDDSVAEPNVEPPPIVIDPSQEQPPIADDSYIPKQDDNNPPNNDVVDNQDDPVVDNDMGYQDNPVITDNNNNDDVCKDLSAQNLMAIGIRAPSASQASSHLFSLMSSVNLVNGENSLILKAKEHARKVDKLDLLMDGKGKESRIRLILDRNNYVIEANGVYVLTFGITSKQQEGFGANTESCMLSFKDAQLAKLEQ